MKSDKAVSPVVGVMLMLVVTIVLAAVVSSFSGGMVSEQPRAPQMSGVVYFESVGPANYTILDNPEDKYSWDPGFSGNITYASDTPYKYRGYANANGNNYVVIEHKGGDTINKNQILVQLQSGTTKVTIDGASDRVSIIGGGTLFKPGSKMKVLPTQELVQELPVKVNVTGHAADYFNMWCGASLNNSTWTVVEDPCLTGGVWLSYNNLALEPNKILQITLIDKNSDKPIFHWEFVLNYNY